MDLWYNTCKTSRAGPLYVPGLAAGRVAGRLQTPDLWTLSPKIWMVALWFYKTGPEDIKKKTISPEVTRSHFLSVFICPDSIFFLMVSKSFLHPVLLLNTSGYWTLVNSVSWETAVMFCHQLHKMALVLLQENPSHFHILEQQQLVKVNGKKPPDVQHILELINLWNR